MCNWSSVTVHGCFSPVETMKLHCTELTEKEMPVSFAPFCITVPFYRLAFPPDNRVTRPPSNISCKEMDRCWLSEWECHGKWTQALRGQHTWNKTDVVVPNRKKIRCQGVCCGGVKAWSSPPSPSEGYCMSALLECGCTRHTSILKPFTGASVWRPLRCLGARLET